MNQSWVYDALDTLAVLVHKAMLNDIKNYPWFGSHDNLNITHRVFEQRLSNQSHFDSGTAGTIFVVKDPSTVRLNSRELQAQIALGSKSLITLEEIYALNSVAGPRIHQRAVYKVLSILINSPGFDFESYTLRGDPLFEPLPPVQQLPTGPNSATTQYMLNTVHIEEASYEGNLRLLEEWFRQLRITSQDEQIKFAIDNVLIWIGDQLTTSRLRGNQKYRCEDHNSWDCIEYLVKQIGFFHAQMAQEHSIHEQHYGTSKGRGLAFAFNLLNRRGLSKPSIKGTFHHHLQEGLLHVSEALFHDLWCVLGRVDSLEKLRLCSPAELYALAERIVLAE
ncbi:hypothetical protein WOLCODRAFT_77838 [Wolfiporia cocos MD-104 SS10]|uniref:DUF6589 domain-containing protein n=1 Tax=Wolfiporia cocos (strain MD-104) TaxID=742152 RepID=A0A2H3JU30_WOLCO|nr:hypothetical protein WOLCODRAFT_77838 [Wolfiporia cocos MD-104 SS10]